MSGGLIPYLSPRHAKGLIGSILRLEPGVKRMTLQISSKVFRVIGITIEDYQITI